MGYKVIVCLLAIEAVFLLTSPMEGAYHRRFEDRYEGNTLFLEFPGQPDEYTTMQKRPFSMTSPTEGYVRHFEDRYERNPSRVEPPFEIIDGAANNPNQFVATQKETNTVKPTDEGKRSLYLPVAVIMAKDLSNECN